MRWGDVKCNVTSDVGRPKSSRVLKLSLERKHKNRFTNMANNKHKYDSDMFTIVSNEREGR